MKNKSKQNIKELNTIKKFDIIFKKLKEAEREQIEITNMSESDYLEIDKSIQILQEIKQSINVPSYTLFTRA